MGHSANGKLPSANERAEDLLRQINSATGDLRRAMREARELTDHLDARIDAAIQGELEARFLAACGPAITEAQGELQAAQRAGLNVIMDQFETVTETLTRITEMIKAAGGSGNVRFTALKMNELLRLLDG